jgi:hypothetical protein
MSRFKPGDLVRYTGAVYSDEGGWTDNVGRIGGLVRGSSRGTCWHIYWFRQRQEFWASEHDLEPATEEEAALIILEGLGASDNGDDYGR